MRGDEVIVEAGSEQSEDRVKWGTNNANESTYLIFFVENDAKKKTRAHTQRRTHGHSMYSYKYYRCGEGEEKG